MRTASNVVMPVAIGVADASRTADGARDGSGDGIAGKVGAAVKAGTGVDNGSRLSEEPVEHPRVRRTTASMRKGHILVAISEP